MMRVICPTEMAVLCARPATALAQETSDFGALSPFGDAAPRMFSPPNENGEPQLPVRYGNWVWSVRAIFLPSVCRPYRSAFRPTRSVRAFALLQQNRPGAAPVG